MRIHLTPRASSPNDLLLPPGTRLLHIGPHKTGTTTLQAAAANRRATLREHGVLYPGRTVNHSRAASAALGRNSGWAKRSKTPIEPHRWQEVLDEVTETDDRVLVSSEYFCESGPDDISRIVRDLGASRVHIAVTLRPLLRVLPSAWQQGVKGGSATTFEHWLGDRVAELPPPGEILPFVELSTFWERHHHASLIDRWVHEVGPTNLTVVVADPKDHALLPHAFESMLGLPEDLLHDPDAPVWNRSLTAAEAEMLRLVNEAFREARLSWREYGALVRRGVTSRMVAGRTPGSDEPRTATPRWAREHAARLGAETAAHVESLGVRVIGDLDSLATDPDDEDGIGPDPLRMPVRAAAEAVLGGLSGATRGGAWFGDPAMAHVPHGRAMSRPEAPPAKRPVSELSTRELVGQLRRRLVRRLPGR